MPPERMFGWDYPPGVTGREPAISGEEERARPHEFDDSAPAPVWTCDDCGLAIHEEEGGAFSDGADTLCAGCASAREEARLEAAVDEEEWRREG